MFEPLFEQYPHDSRPEISELEKMNCARRVCSGGRNNQHLAVGSVIRFIYIIYCYSLCVCISRYTRVISA